MKRVLSSAVIALCVLFVGSVQAQGTVILNPSFEAPLSPYDWQVVTTDPTWVNRRTGYGSYPARLGGGLILPTSGSYMLCITGQAASQDKAGGGYHTPTFVVAAFGSSGYAGGQTLLVDVTFLSSYDQVDRSVSEISLNGVVAASLTGQTQKWRTYAIPTQPGPQELVIRAESMLPNWGAPWGSGQSTICVDNVRIVGATF